MILVALGLGCAAGVRAQGVPGAVDGVDGGPASSPGLADIPSAAPFVPDQGTVLITSTDWLPLTPSVRITGLAGMQLGKSISLLSGRLGGPGEFMVGVWIEGAGLGFNEAFVLSGEIPNGEYSIVDLWDGVSTYPHSEVNGFLEAGDVNGDGSTDLWVAGDLYAGPFLGRALSEGERLAWLDAKIVVAADFDADQDGIGDIVFETGGGWVIVYGPHEGALPSDVPDAGEELAAGTSYLGGGEVCNSKVSGSVLRDHLGLGHPALLLGADDKACTFPATDSWVFDAWVPRGARIPLEQAQAAIYSGSEPLSGATVGDLTGDGLAEPILYWLDGGWIVEGPLEGSVSVLDAEVIVDADGAMVFFEVGDLNGDGISELSTTYGLLFSPYEDDFAEEPVLPLDTLGLDALLSAGDDLGSRHADIDGDGLHDIVWAGIDGFGPAPYNQQQGDVLIWYGKDLIAGYDEMIAADAD